MDNDMTAPRWEYREKTKQSPDNHQTSRTLHWALVVWWLSGLCFVFLGLPIGEARAVSSFYPVWGVFIAPPRSGSPDRHRILLPFDRRARREARRVLHEMRREAKLERRELRRQRRRQREADLVAWNALMEPFEG